MRVILVALIILVPVFSQALVASEEEALKAQIRADLLADSRTATLSEADFETMVVALAQEMTLQGNAAQYLEDRLAPTYASDFAETFTIVHESGYPSAGVFLGLASVIVALFVLLMLRSRGPKLVGIPLR